MDPKSFAIGFVAGILSIMVVGIIIMLRGKRNLEDYEKSELSRQFERASLIDR